ncbi:bacteriocin immunity protein [Lacticaseibacillus songhuajiangensis]|jgi:hypothetical protein|uniref:bacteriocin immunity protein n=1 Tax=Lacticaseibacillus songhuajiangensis TaxID=1296539 RepID=UPI000F788197|nr:bacteriocin immunity protein [Lacticaseibacillus songhuajiangensis]
MTKHTETELMTQINDLLADDSIPETERTVLLTARTELTKKVADVRVAQKLKQQLQLPAAQLKLSPQMIEFLTWMSKNYLGFGRPGMGLTLL